MDKLSHTHSSGLRIVMVLKILKGEMTRMDIGLAPLILTGRMKEPLIILHLVPKILMVRMKAAMKVLHLALATWLEIELESQSQLVL